LQHLHICTGRQNEKTPIQAISTPRPSRLWA
jgi:hypothetical protein